MINYNLAHLRSPEKRPISCKIPFLFPIFLTTLYCTVTGSVVSTLMFTLCNRTLVHFLVHFASSRFIIPFIILWRVRVAFFKRSWHVWRLYLVWEQVWTHSREDQREPKSDNPERISERKKIRFGKTSLLCGLFFCWVKYDVSSAFRVITRS